MLVGIFNEIILLFERLFKYFISEWIVLLCDEIIILLLFFNVGVIFEC